MCIHQWNIGKSELLYYAFQCVVFFQQIYTLSHFRPLACALQGFSTELMTLDSNQSFSCTFHALLTLQSITALIPDLIFTSFYVPQLSFLSIIANTTFRFGFLIFLFFKHTLCLPKLSCTILICRLHTFQVLSYPELS